MYTDFSFNCEILSSTIICDMDILGQISQAADYVRDWLPLMGKICQMVEVGHPATYSTRHAHTSYLSQSSHATHVEKKLSCGKITSQIESVTDT